MYTISYSILFISDDSRPFVQHFTKRFAIAKWWSKSFHLHCLLFFCPLFSQQLHIQEDLNVLPVKMHLTTMNAIAGLQISTVHEVPTSP